MGLEPHVRTLVLATSLLGATGGSAPLRLQDSFLEHLRGLPPMPRKIHLTWPDPGVVNSEIPMVQHGLRRLIQLNPGWNTTVYDDAAIDAYLRSSPLLTAADLALIEPAHIVEKTDAFRLLVMYQEGGFYQDVDRVYNRALDTVLEGAATKMLLPTYFDVNFMQDVMCTSPGNRAVKAAIDLQWAIRRGDDGKGLPRVNGWSRAQDVLRMGPKVWNTALAQELFGVPAIRGKMQFIAARQALRKGSPILLTHRDAWCDGMFVRPYDNCKRIGREALYAAYGIKPWKVAVNRAWQQRGGAGS